MSTGAHPLHRAASGEQPPLVSVVLPNYNDASSLPVAISALLAQDLPPDEIIVVDDCSSDESVPLLGRIAPVLPTLRLLRNRANLGVVASLNRGLSEAAGSYVYFGAADDWVFPDSFRRAVAALQAHPDLAFYCGDTVLYDAGTHRVIGTRPAARPRLSGGPVTSGAYTRLLRGSDNHLHTGSILFRRSLLGRGLDEELGSFADGFMARTLALDGGFYYDARIVAAWVVDGASFSRRTATELDLALRSLELYPKRIAASPAFPSWYAELFERRWRFTTTRLALQNSPFDRQLVAAMVGAGEPAIPRHVEHAIDRGSRLGNFHALAWLLCRLRPFSVAGIVRMLASQSLQLGIRFSARDAWPELAPVVAAAIGSDPR